MADFLLDQVCPDEIIWITDKVESSNLLDILLKERQDNLDMIKHFRFFFTKLLWTFFWIGFHRYEDALDYFFEHKLKVPEAMAQPFGEDFGSYLREEENHIVLLGFFSLWLVMALQLLITAVAWEFRDDWQTSVACYTIGLPMIITFILNFTVLHLPNWKPPSSLPYE